eukprot:s687_g9.t1
MARALVLSLVLALASAESVKDCIESKCSGCGGEQCQLCREDVNTVSACLSSCMDSLCRACGGEQCQLCREDASHIETGLTKSHKGWHLHPPPISEEVYRFVVPFPAGQDATSPDSYRNPCVLAPHAALAAGVAASDADANARGGLSVVHTLASVLVGMRPEVPFPLACRLLLPPVLCAWAEEVVEGNEVAAVSAIALLSEAMLGPAPTEQSLRRLADFVDDSCGKAGLPPQLELDPAESPESVAVLLAATAAKAPVMSQRPAAAWVNEPQRLEAVFRAAVGAEKTCVYVCARSASGWLKIVTNCAVPTGVGPGSQLRRLDMDKVNPEHLPEVYERKTFPFNPSAGPSPVDSRLSTPAISVQSSRHRALGGNRPHVLTTHGLEFIAEPGPAVHPAFGRSLSVTSRSQDGLGFRL